jgi:hypothetical protein
MPREYTLIHLTMHLKLKLLQTGAIDKYKARLCACGNELADEGYETYSPTIAGLTYATVLQLAVIDQMHMCTVDTVGAYLYQDYPKDAKPLFLTLPEQVARVCGLDPRMKYRVNKYLYGLPDSGRAYYKAYAKLLMENGYMRTKSDPCLFTKINDESRTYVWTHVDDTFVCSTDPQELTRFQAVVRKQFKITVNENVTEYLGIKLTKLHDGSIKLTQPKLLRSLFEEYDGKFVIPKRRITPQRSVGSMALDDTPMSRTEYLHLLGALIYLTKSRPDIQTAVSFGATNAAKPTHGAYKELLHCLSYLYQTREEGLILVAGKSHRRLVLKCFVDASYLTHHDSKSHTGYCLSFGDISTFYSKSGKQTVVTTSSTHAELKALYTLIIDILYVMYLCEELDRPLSLPVIVMEDNQPAIDLTMDLSSRSRKCKHFLMLVNYIREQIAMGILELRKVPTEDNIADTLTKIVVGDDFQNKAGQLMGKTHESKM